MLKKYLIFLPEVKGGIEEEWRQCLDKIRDTRINNSKLIKLNIFTDLDDYATFLKVSSEIGNSIKYVFGDLCPAFNITVHPPEKPWKVAVEAGYMEADTSEIVSKVCNSIPYIVRTSESGQELWVGGLGAGLFPSDTRRAAEAAFDQMRAILEAEDMSFNNIVRQWNYIGNILEVRNGIQNYQIFNEVRSENYHKYRSVKGYPAATGVGIKYGGVILDFFAVKPENPLKILAIDNPDQIHPYAYGQEVLVGVPNGGRKVKQPPQFERAMLLTDNHDSTIFVSGTASIIGQVTIGTEDINKQTVVTIENINKLANPWSIKQLIHDTESNTWKSILLRVYIKYQKDFARVKAICEREFPGVPAVYIEADICRDDLLVEIEAEFTKKHLYTN
jgi:enamine deaminase RidA (YjgF/YER057c/UK114 family)